MGIKLKTEIDYEVEYEKYVHSMLQQMVEGGMSDLEIKAQLALYNSDEKYDIFCDMYDVQNNLVGELTFIPELK